MKGQASAAKRGARAAAEGVVSSYVHANGKIGVLVEVDCETDFVARTEPFQEFAREVALHIAATADPQYVSDDEVPDEVKRPSSACCGSRPPAEGKPENVQEKIVEGRLNKWLEDIVLLHQTHVNEDKHGGKSIEALRAALALGHRGEHRRAAFPRFQVGEE